MNTIDDKFNKNETNNTEQKRGIREKIKEYWNGCIDPNKSRLYGTFQERAALNITQFPKIQGSLLIRMGIVYPIASYIVEELGLPKDAHTDIFGMTINYHTWIAGYLAYLVEIQAGLSKYAIEGVTNGIKKTSEILQKTKQYFKNQI